MGPDWAASPHTVAAVNRHSRDRKRSPAKRVCAAWPSGQTGAPVNGPEGIPSFFCTPQHTFFDISIRRLSPSVAMADVVGAAHRPLRMVATDGLFNAPAIDGNANEFDAFCAGRLHQAA